MNDSRNNLQRPDVEFLSPAGQLRHDSMLRELSAELGSVQTQRRFRRRLTYTACSAVLLVALTSWAVNVNVKSNVDHPQPPGPIVDSTPSFITRVTAAKSTRWTPISIGAVEAGSDSSTQSRVQRVESDDDFLELLHQTGYETVGLIRSEGQTTITGDIASFKTVAPDSADSPAAPLFEGANETGKRNSAPTSALSA